MKIAKNSKEKKKCEKLMKFKQLLKISFGTKIQFFDNFQNEILQEYILAQKFKYPTILSKLYFWSKIRLLEKCKITKWVPKVLFVYTLKKLCLHSTVVNCIFQITDALTFLHTSCRYVHRNVCPHSIFVTRSGNWKLGGLEFIGKFLQKKTWINVHF